MGMGVGTVAGYNIDILDLFSAKFINALPKQSVKVILPNPRTSCLKSPLMPQLP
jgi:hypothetical protein